MSSLRHRLVKRSGRRESRSSSLSGRGSGAAAARRDTVTVHDSSSASDARRLSQDVPRSSDTIASSRTRSWDRLHVAWTRRSQGQPDRSGFEASEEAESSSEWLSMVTKAVGVAARAVARHTWRMRPGCDFCENSARAASATKWAVRYPHILVSGYQTADTRMPTLSKTQPGLRFRKCVRTVAAMARSQLLRGPARRGLDARDPRPHVAGGKCPRILPYATGTCPTGHRKWCVHRARRSRRCNDLLSGPRTKDRPEWDTRMGYQNGIQESC